MRRRTSHWRALGIIIAFTSQMRELRAPRLLLSITVAAALHASCAAAQSPVGLGPGGRLDVGGEAERYLRALELAGSAPAHHWTIRPLTAGKTGFSVDSAHPWQERWKAAKRGGTLPRLLRPSVRVIGNSTFPVQWGRGPTWAGRGFTVEAQAGFEWNVGVLHVQVAPTGFITQNSAFTLAANGLTGEDALRDARVPGGIDAPQRFGERSYGRIDAGASMAELRLPFLLVGVSTAARSWGPAVDYPLVLGPSSGGFAHAYVGTRAPVNIGPVSFHGLVLAGSPEQSAWSPATQGVKGRTTAGTVLTVGSRYVPGLEVGFVRFVHQPSDAQMPSPSFVARLFSTGLSRQGSVNLGSENGLASFFARWAFPGAGIEVYGEYYREDYSFDTRWLLQYPDDFGAYMLGLQRVYVASGKTLRAFRIEVVNGEPSTSNRGERGDRFGSMAVSNPIYQHSGVRQGHTNRGLFLGSPEAFGGAAVRMTLDRYTPKGRTSWVLERALRLDWLASTPTTTEGPHPDVMISLRGEVVRFIGAREFTLSVAPAFDLNRNLQPGHDVFNLNASFSVRGLR